jgi:hypothetical protein
VLGASISASDGACTGVRDGGMTRVEVITALAVGELDRQDLPAAVPVDPDRDQHRLAGDHAGLAHQGNRDPRDRAAGPDRLILPAMQQTKQPFRARLQLLARLTVNAGGLVRITG